MRDAASQHAGEFAFTLGMKNQTRIDVLEASRERECVWLVGVDHANGDGQAGIGILCDFLSDSIYVFVASCSPSFFSFSSE